MGQMSASRQIKPHKRIARLQQRQKHRLVRLAAGIRLHIGEFAPEQLAHALDRELFRNIDELAPAIIAPPRIPLGIFIGHDRALRLEHRARHDIFGRDQLDLVALPPELQPHRLRDFRITIGQSRREE